MSPRIQRIYRTQTLALIRLKLELEVFPILTYTVLAPTRLGVYSVRALLKSGVLDTNAKTSSTWCHDKLGIVEPKGDNALVW